MKRLLTSGALFLCSLLTFAQFSGSGSGTESDPYLIFNATQLSQLSNYLNKEGVVFKLMADLDLAGWIEENNPRQGWGPVGVESSPFKGILYGNSHKISGLFINRGSTNHVGLFGYISGATIKDLTVVGTSVTGASYVGGLVGYATGSTITNCHVRLSENGLSGVSNIGGFFGYAGYTTCKSFSVATTVRSSDENVGGVAGQTIGSTFSDGTFAGNITCNKDYIGGLAGKARNITLSNIKVEGDIAGQDNIGGLLGCCNNGNLTNCTYCGTLVGNQYVGGVAGTLENTASTFISCFSKGKITATGNYTGGIIGLCKGACIEEMESCGHFGDITGKTYLGGLVGAVLDIAKDPRHTHEEIIWSKNVKKHNKWIYETIITGDITTKKLNNCVAIGNIFGNSYVGGVIGNESAAINYTVSKSEYTNRNYLYNSYYYFENGENLGQNIICNTYARNTASLSLTNNYYSGTLKGIQNVGGLVGYKSGGIIQQNYVYANIYGSSNLGGIVGQVSANKVDDAYTNTTIKSNVAINNIISATSYSIGRIYGLVEADYTIIGALASSEGNRALTQTRVLVSGVAQEVNDDLQNGTSIGPSALKMKANYVSWGWDFDDNWEIIETECFPYKKYQTAPPVVQSTLISQATSISGKSVDGGKVYLDYKDNLQETVATGNLWSFTVPPLQSGKSVQIYAEADGKIPSYYNILQVAYPGKGTLDDPYRVYTADDLACVNNKGYYKQMNDIDLTSWIQENSPTEGWIPAGRDGGEITQFDGDNYKVTGLWTNTTKDYTGLFSNFSQGTIKNLNVEIAKGKQVKGGNYTGGLIGRNINGKIDNCTVKGKVVGTTTVGGVIGYSRNNELNTLLFTGTIENNTQAACVGGIAGKSENDIINRNQTNLTITATGANTRCGGLIGMSNSTITESLSAGKLSARGATTYVGGIVGYAESSNKISNCFSQAEVTSGYSAAGITAYNFGLIEKSYADGDIWSNIFGAGIVSYNDGTSAIVKNCVALNKRIEVTYESQQEGQGGGYGQRIIGGYKNGAPQPELNNYALKTMQVSVNSVPQIVSDDILNGAAKLGSELMKSNTYKELGWDFSDTWSITEGESYPALKHNEATVGKADEEPVLSMDEQLEVDEVVASKGKSVSVDIDLNNKATDLSAYQFDLTLPAGFTLAMNGKKYQVTKTARYEDDGQTLNVSAVEGKERTYRFVSFSLSNSVITETSGAILNAIIEVADNVEPGTYGAHITAITFTKADGTQLKLNDTKFNITVNSITLGDVNGDGEVNVADIVEIVNYIMEKPSAIFRQTAADVNGDNEVNVADIVQVVNMILVAGGSNSRLLAPVEVQSTDGDYMTLSNDGELCLDNQGGYVASQFDVKLSHGQRLTGITLDGIRSCGHCMTYTLLGSDTYRVVVYSTDNSPFVGNDGALLKLDVEGCGTVTVDNIVMVTASQEVRRFATMSNQTTGIVSATVSASSADIYTTDGRLVRHQATSTEGLPQGVYIIDGKKKLVK